MTPQGKKERSSSEIEKASIRKRREKYMVIYAKVQMTGNWPQTPGCVIISPSTTACSSAGGKDGKGAWKKRKQEKLNEWSPPQTNPTNKHTFFQLVCLTRGYQFNLRGLFLNGTTAWLLLLLLYCLSGSRRGHTEEVVSRRRRDNLMDVCWYLDH